MTLVAPEAVHRERCVTRVGADAPQLRRRSVDRLDSSSLAGRGADVHAVDASPASSSGSCRSAQHRRGPRPATAADPASSSTGTPSRSALSSFDPAWSPATSTLGLLRDRGGHAGARRQQPLRRLLAGQRGQGPGEHRGHALEQRVVRRRSPASSTSSWTPASRSRSKTSRNAGSASRPAMIVAIFSPTPGRLGERFRGRRDQRVDRAEARRQVAPGDRADLLDPDAEQHPSERPLPRVVDRRRRSGWRRRLGEALELDELLGAQVGRGPPRRAPAPGRAGPGPASRRARRCPSPRG